MDRRTAAIAVVLLLIGVALRINQLGTLSLTGDEIFTIFEGNAGLKERLDRDTAERWNVRWAYRTNPLHQIGTEFALKMCDNEALAGRLFPFVWGIAALVVLPWLMTRVCGPKAGLVLLALLVFCPMHVDFSRFARYQSAAFLFGGALILAATRWSQHGQFRDAIIGIVAAALAIATHVTGLMVVGTMIVFVVFSRPKVWSVLGLAALVGTAGYVLRAKIKATLRVIREAIPRPPGSPTLFKLTASITYAVGPAVMLIAAWQGLKSLREKDRIGIGFAMAAGLPFLAIGLMSYRAPVGIRYYAAALPGAIFLAAWGLQKLSWVQVKASRLTFATALLCVTELPVLVSDQIDGQRYDFAAVARHLEEFSKPEDLIIAKWHGILDHYIERDTEELKIYRVPWIERLINERPQKRVFLLLLSQRGQVVFPDREQNLEDWLKKYAVRSERFGRKRLDSMFYCFELLLYEIDAEAVRKDFQPTQ